MSNIPQDLKYTKDHEWVRVSGDIATVGITDHAQQQLGDVVYVELPKVGDRFDAEAPFGSLESVKAVSEAFSPLTGEVTEVNQEVVDEPELVNTEPYGDGWLVKLRVSDTKQLSNLLDAAGYAQLLKDAE